MNNFLESVSFIDYSLGFPRVKQRTGSGSPTYSVIHRLVLLYVKLCSS